MKGERRTCDITGFSQSARECFHENVGNQFHLLLDVVTSQTCFLCLCVLSSLPRRTAHKRLITTPTASTCQWPRSTRTKIACSMRWATRRASGTHTPSTTTSVRCDPVGRRRQPQGAADVWIWRVHIWISPCHLNQIVSKRQTLLAERSSSQRGSEDQ